METVVELICLGSKITANGDCSHEIERLLLLGRKAMTNLDSVLKSRDITLTKRVHLVKAMVFPVVTYGCEERWTIKKVEQWKTGAFKLCCWRRPLRVPWTARRSNLFLIQPKFSSKLKISAMTMNKNRKSPKVIKKKVCLETLKLEELTWPLLSWDYLLLLIYLWKSTSKVSSL